MINGLRGVAALMPLLAAVTFVATTAAFSQAPTEAQREAIKSECRSDYMAHCSSIPPGGAASLECLQKNMSSLAPRCQSAVRAVETPAAEPKAEIQAGVRPGGNGGEARRGTGGSAEGCRKRASQEAEQRADISDTQRLPLRLSEGLRGRADRRRSGAGVPGEEQVEGLRGMPKGGRRGRRWWRRAGFRRCAGSGGNRKPGCGPRGSGADGAGAAADAAARGAVCDAIGLRRRRPRALPRRRTRRRPHHRMSGSAGGFAIAPVQGSAGTVCRAVTACMHFRF